MRIDVFLVALSPLLLLFLAPTGSAEEFCNADGDLSYYSLDCGDCDEIPLFEFQFETDLTRPPTLQEPLPSSRVHTAVCNP